MQAWLTNHNMQYNTLDLKADLMAKIAAAHPHMVYFTDVKAEAVGHVVVRLPVAHCELSP